jgi:hypothetical protein
LVKSCKGELGSIKNATNENACALNVVQNEIMFLKENHDNIADLIKTDYPELISKGVGLIKNHKASISIKRGRALSFEKLIPCNLL